MRINQDEHVTRARFRRLRFKWTLFFLLLFVFLIFFHLHNDEGNEENQERMTEEEINVEDIERLRESPDIRVLIQSGNYEGIYHKSVEIMLPDGGYLLYYRNNGWTKHTIAAGETVVIAQKGGDYNLSKDETAVLLPAKTDGVTVIGSIVRNRSTCDYPGRIEISVSGDGLTVVNVLPLETYLKLVVPSEMPASFDMETLKAQAILARTYAYHYLLSPAYEEQNAHVDDSISFQVYGNLDANEATDEAVESTEGVLLFDGNNLAEVYYYSTSWGFGTDGTVWGGDGQTYLRSVRIGPGVLYNSLLNLTEEDAETYLLQYLKSELVFRSMMDEPFVPAYESALPWYRWQAVNESVDVTEMEKRLKERYASDPSSVLTQNKDGSFSAGNIKNIGTLQNIEVYERGEGGIVESLLITGSKNTYLVNREYNIRYVLCSSDVLITRQDGVTVDGNTLLPSGFFYILTTKTGQNGLSYTLRGGGYGHGVGMSQNGANQMARVGLSCEEILSFYFLDTRLVKYEGTDS
ncbi:MAG: SpoIID/LytB domain-containing protein [Lachnospiraceae bacterium]|nr:SpoIID/LytB domain-containing protein [Lachnospiraceae bacterium]